MHGIVQRYNLIYFHLFESIIQCFITHLCLTLKRVGRGIPEKKSPCWAVIGWYTDPWDKVYVIVETYKVWALQNMDNQNVWNDLQCKLVAMLHRGDFQWNFNVNKCTLTHAANALICHVGLGALHNITHEVRLQVFMLVTGSHVVRTNTNWIPASFYCHIVRH